MASLYKPTITTYQLPDGRHRDQDGKRVIKVTPGAVRVKRKSEVWYGRYKNADGILVRVRLCANKEAARQALNQLEADAVKGLAGAIDRFADHNKRPLLLHLEDFEQHLRTKVNKRGTKNTHQHVRLTVQRIRTLAEGCRFKNLPDMADESAADKMENFLGGLEISAQSRNHYRKVFKSFVLWLLEGKRLRESHLIRLGTENVDGDKRHARRVFTQGELGWLLPCTNASQAVFRGLNGQDRYALYLTALGTGFRVSELHSLTPGSFDLLAAIPCVSVDGRFTKNRKTIYRRPIPETLAAEVLQPYLAGKLPTAPIWRGTWKEKASRMVRPEPGWNVCGLPRLSPHVRHGHRPDGRQRQDHSRAYPPCRRSLDDGYLCPQGQPGHGRGGKQDSAIGYRNRWRALPAPRPRLDRAGDRA